MNISTVLFGLTTVVVLGAGCSSVSADADEGVARAGDAVRVSKDNGATVENPAPIPPPPGGDSDAHGCKPSAGYTWCANENACVRPWELAASRGFENSREAFSRYCDTVNPVPVPPAPEPAPCPPPGGGCRYRDTIGTATIVSVTPARQDQNNCRTDPREVQFSFSVSGGANVEKGTLLFGDGKNPPASCLGAEGIRVGASFPVVRRTIVSGTCSPVVYDFMGAFSTCANQCFL